MSKTVFNLHKQARSYTPPSPSSSGKKSRKRIKDRGIKWEESYGQKSDDLKVKFDKDLGPGAYRRWEGHDYTTDSDYFVVVGPAVTKEGKKKFFSGIKKLPPKWKRAKIYAPSGEYFHNLHGALSHAKEKWNIPFPKNQQNFSTNDLMNIDIPRHVKA